VPDARCSRAVPRMSNIITAAERLIALVIAAVEVGIAPRDAIAFALVALCLARPQASEA
jgi:hypothetical protein